MKDENNNSCEVYQNNSDIRTGFINFPSGPREVKYAVINGLAIFEGDIILGTLEQMENSSIVPMSIGVTGDQFLWPDGIIYYTIDSSLPNQQRVTDAIAHWESRTFIRFVQRTTEANYVTFSPGTGCSSSIGMLGGQQIITLENNCTTGNAIHEIGHTVGLFHEQSREDRDSFVRINYANIQTGQAFNFDKHITDADDYGPYDYLSIMHYDQFAFSSNGLPTIEPLIPGVTIGQRIELSGGDVAGVYELYKRKGEVSAVSRKPDQLDIFTLDFDGNVWTNWWTPDNDWWTGHKWAQLPGTPPGGFNRSTKVAAVSRYAEELDIFALDNEGNVWANWWTPDNDWWTGHKWAQLPGTPPGGFNKSTPVAAVSRNPNQIDIFALDNEGNVWANWWSPTNTWWFDPNHPDKTHEWAQLPGTPPGGFCKSIPLTVVSRNPNQIDIFALDNEGNVWANWWFPTNTWWFDPNYPDRTHEWAQLPGTPPGGFYKNSSVVAVSRYDEELDIFAIDNEGNVWTNWWTPDNDWWTGHTWAQLPGTPPGGFNRSAPVAAVSRNPNQIDIFVLDKEGNVWANWWFPTNTWWFDPNHPDKTHEWAQLPGTPPGGFNRSTSVAAVSRYDEELDIFVIDKDRKVWTNWWTPNNDWWTGHTWAKLPD